MDIEQNEDTREQPRDAFAPRKMGASMATAVAAGLVGLCALGVSVYEAYLMRQQQMASVMPILEAWSSYSSEGFSVNLANKGLGPAILRSVRVSVDGTPKHSWTDVYEEVLGMRPTMLGTSAVSGNVAAPGERVSMIRFARDDSAAAIWRGSERVALELCYCSVFDECWKHRLENVRSGVPRTVEVPRCETDTASNF